MPFSLSLPDLPAYVLIAAPIIVLIGYVVFGSTGFGSSLISVPLLSHLLPLTFTVPLITATDALASISTAVRLRRLVVWREFLRLVPAILIGIALGVTLLLNLPREPALLALGMFVASYGIYVIAGPRRIARVPDWLVWPLGIAGGVFSTLFGTGGPIYMVFLSARIEDKSRLRATSAIIVAFNVWIRIALFIATGLLLDSALQRMALLLLPIMALGLWLGNRLHHALSRAGVLRLIAGLLTINGVLLIVRAGESLWR